MEFIQQSDLNLIQQYSGREYEEDKHNELKKIYEKLDYLCKQLALKGFNYTIRKDPRKQAGQGVFEFRDYQWARIYPSEYYEACYDKFCYIIGLSDSLHFHMMGYKQYQNESQSIEASKKSWYEIDLEGATYESVVSEFVEFDKNNRVLFIETGAALGISQLVNELKSIRNMKLMELLKAKKQVILQGPPGTGKTRLAKQIAKDLCMPNEISEIQISSIIKPLLKINSITDYTTYTVESITPTAVNLRLQSGTLQSPSFKKIIEAFKQKKWDGGTIGGDAYEAAVAKFIYNNIFSNDQYKIVQFHPSYNYEDFVRGIVAESSGDRIEYRSVNKVLGEFAKEAMENLKMSQEDNLYIQKERWVNERFDEFRAEIENYVEQNELNLSGDIGLFEVQSDCFKYGKNWKVHSRINYSDFKKLVFSVLVGELKVDQSKIDKELSIHAHYRSTYYLSLLRIFLEKNQFQESSEKTNLKNYVLVIDEINRANLPSVLGELIYALEYRDEAVESIYAIDGDNKLILPSNLFIIGTMNTADRSVGHIDYAIRRRFAFVELLPSKEPVADIAVPYFKKVSELFIKNFDGINWSNLKLERSESLAPDFRPQDVWLGHSYFIIPDSKTDGQIFTQEERQKMLKQKLCYEVLPILQEYVKDGILLETETVKSVISELSQIK